MALASSTKSKLASKASKVTKNNCSSSCGSNASTTSKSDNGTSKQRSQTHRRSRTGCYTCRLRRKKCDERSPICSACRHLGLDCQYRRPSWWANSGQRCQVKDEIKVIIKHKKTIDKASQALHLHSSSDPPPFGLVIGSPPELSHSASTPTTYADTLDRTRSASVDSRFGQDFGSLPTTHVIPPTTPQINADIVFLGGYAPYEVDIKTEREMFIDDIPTLRETSTCTYAAADPIVSGGYVPWIPGPSLGEWPQPEFYERRESLGAESVAASSAMDIPAELPTDNGPIPAAAATGPIQLDEGDQRLRDHFAQFVLPTIFPVLELNRPGLVHATALPALERNQGYLHCCLSIAAQHFKTVMGLAGDEMDSDIMRHRYATISSLCNALALDENHQDILDAALGLVFYPSIAGRPTDNLPDIPWHQHLQAALSLMQRLELPRLVEPGTSEASGPVPLSMSLTAWADILGATMLGKAPVFAHLYRDKYLSTVDSSLGLRELVGCDDRVLYIISEIACIEDLRRDGMDDILLCHHVHVLGDQIGLTEMSDYGNPLKLPFKADGNVDADQLNRNITAAFRLAARIYLCSLVPGFQPQQASCVGLVNKLTHVLQNVPSGPSGFDRAVVWAYVIGGSVSQPGSSFRTFFDDRVAQLGELADVGTFGRIVCLLREVWAQNDCHAAEASAATAAMRSPSPCTAAAGSASTPSAMAPVVSAAAAAPAAIPSPPQGASPMPDTPQPYTIPWRDIMQTKGWDFLFI